MKQQISRSRNQESSLGGRCSSRGGGEDCEGERVNQAVAHVLLRKLQRQQRRSWRVQRHRVQ